MVYSKVEALSPSQENTREAFISYLRNVVGRKGKTPIHLTDSLERRIQIFARECVDPSFTCAYDYQDSVLFEQILQNLRTTWSGCLIISAMPARLLVVSTIMPTTCSIAVPMSLLCYWIHRTHIPKGASHTFMP